MSDTIRCLPRGVCSWNFHLTGKDHRADVELGTFRDRGRIRVDDEHAFEVRREGLLSRTWTLVTPRDSPGGSPEGPRGGSVVRTAEKLPLRRSYEIGLGSGATGTLRPRTLFSSAFVLEQGLSTLATIRTDHLFTRRASIQTAGRGVDFPTICFAFWLTAMTWRRTRRSS